MENKEKRYVALEGQVDEVAQVLGIGLQDFEMVRKQDNFYVDKTDFICEWWENGDSVTLITRPRRFGKTLMMSMVEKFFSVQYAGRSDLFEGLKIWQLEKYRKLQGTYPVLFFSLADIKFRTFEMARRSICRKILALHYKFQNLNHSDFREEIQIEKMEDFLSHMTDDQAVYALQALMGEMEKYYGKKVIVLLDEYDTPMHEAYLNGYWDEMLVFIRNLFHAAFKTNPYLERAILTGITRISKESVFSDLNHLTAITTTSEKYETSFGFTESEVFHALDEYGLSTKKEDVKCWYDGFSFGKVTDIYNPWSILNYLSDKKFAPYWANTSSNALVNELIQSGSVTVKKEMEELLAGRSIFVELDEQIVFSQIKKKRSAIWSLLLASGYLKVICVKENGKGRFIYELALTNLEVMVMFEKMILDWFAADDVPYNDFIKALLKGDKKAMNCYMNKVALETFSYFDTANKPSEILEPERFYHGFVLGLIVELSGRYHVTSNRESGFGRYDVMLEPNFQQDDAIILEFKVHDPEVENTLSDTVNSALKQMKEKRYDAVLKAKGIPEERIRNYGFAFQGKKVLIG